MENLKKQDISTFDPGVDLLRSVLCVSASNRPEIIKYVAKKCVQFNQSYWQFGKQNAKLWQISLMDWIALISTALQQLQIFIYLFFRNLPTTSHLMHLHFLQFQKTISWQFFVMLAKYDQIFFYYVIEEDSKFYNIRPHLIFHIYIVGMI